MNTYEELFKQRQIDVITIPAAKYLLNMVVKRLPLYDSASTNHDPSYTFLQTEVVVLTNIKKYLTQYIVEHA